MLRLVASCASNQARPEDDLTYALYDGRAELLQARQKSDLRGYENHQSHIDGGRAAGADYVLVGREVHGAAGMTATRFVEIVRGDEAASQTARPPTARYGF